MQEVNYKITFPVIEMEGIHAKDAIEKALDYLKNNLDKHEIEWEEIPSED